MNMEKISGLYPQYKPSVDRRQNNIPVAIDRRSGNDRRGQERVTLDSKLTRDIYEVKGQIAKFSNFTMDKMPSFASKNNLGQDQFTRQTKPDITERTREQAKLENNSDTSFKMGVIAAGLGGILAASFLGPVGAVIALGSAIYVGTKIVKVTMENEINNNNGNKNA